MTILNRHHQRKFVVTRKILRSIFSFAVISVAVHLPVFENVHAALAGEVNVQKKQKEKAAVPVDVSVKTPSSARKSLLASLSRNGTKFEQNAKGEVTGLSISQRDYTYAVLLKLQQLPKLEKIEILNAGRIQTTHLAAIANVTKLKELALHSASTLNEKGLKQLATLKNLEKLSLSGYRRTDFSSIAKFSRLKTLDLSRTLIDEKSLKKLHSLKGLKELNISECRLLKTMAPQTLSAFTQLESLTVTNNLWFKDRHVAELAKLKNLKHLDLWFVGISDDSLKSLQSFSALRSLKLSGTKFSDQGIAHLASLKNLEQLRFYRTNITDKAMDSIGKLTKLKSLELRYCSKITDEGFKNLEKLKDLEELVFNLTSVSNATLERISKLPKIEILGLAFSKKITDEGWKHLGKMKKLKRLSLESTEIQNKGLMRLANLTNLVEFKLNNCSRVTDVGLEVLKNMTQLEALELRSTKVKLIPYVEKLTKLQSLNLYNSSITDAGLKKLISMKQLRFLDLRQTSVTANAVAGMRNKLAAIHIQSNPAQAVANVRRTSSSRRRSSSSRTRYIVVNIARSMNNEEKNRLFEQLKKLADSTKLETTYVADTLTGTMFYISPVSDPARFKGRLEANLKKIKVTKITALERKIEIQFKD